jgi:GNAT superfamily N-acetyltransferase
MKVQLSIISNELPDDLNELRNAASGEGILLVDRLVREWENGTQKFVATGECLLIARVEASLAGIGGITRDPDDPSSLRMRRFYVLPEYRRMGVGTALVRALLDRATGRRIGVHVGLPDAFPFWQAMGFVPVDRMRITHEYRAA